VHSASRDRWGFPRFHPPPNAACTNSGPAQLP
jgi:hypothetical protein